MLKKNFWKIKALIILLLLLFIFGMDRYVTRSEYEKRKVSEYVIVNNCVVSDTSEGKIYLCDTGRWPELELISKALDVPDDRKE
jgi:hypothetical protein